MTTTTKPFCRFCGVKQTPIEYSEDTGNPVKFIVCGCKERKFSDKIYTITQEEIDKITPPKKYNKAD